MRIEAKLLEGLTMTETIPKRVIKNNSIVTEYQKVTRPMTPDDVLAFRENGGKGVIVTKDGRKFVVHLGVVSQPS